MLENTICKHSYVCAKFRELFTRKCGVSVDSCWLVWDAAVANTLHALASLRWFPSAAAWEAFHTFVETNLNRFKEQVSFLYHTTAHMWCASPHSCLPGGLQTSASLVEHVATCIAASAVTQVKGPISGIRLHLSK